MKLTRGRLVRGAFHIAILGLLGYLVFGFTRPSPATVVVENQTYRITGPYTHENLSVYLIHGGKQDERNFITLAEGLQSGVVKVTEKGTAQVNELTIENTGDDYLFLQEGDRVKGGQQDRTIYTSLVVPPHSGKMPLPAFCVEPSRWVAGAQGMKFGNTANPAVCPKEVRLAAKVQKNQGEVWAAVAQQKQVCVANALSTNQNSSLNESLDAPKVKRIADAFAAALNKVIEGQEDAVGVAIVINGQVEEVNFYPNRALLGKQYPRLVQSYSLAATLKQKDAAKSKPLTAVEVGRFVWQSEQDAKKAEVAKAASGRPVGQAQVEPRAEITNGNVQVMQVRFQEAIGSNNAPFANDLPSTLRRNEVVNKDNSVELVEQASVVNCKTEYQGRLVHRQYLSRNLPPAPRAVRTNRAAQNNDIPQQLMNQQIDNVGLQNIREVQNAPVQQRANPPQGRANP